MFYLYINNMADNGFTQKEMLQLVLDRLDDIDSKIENKIDGKEFYTVIGTIIAIVTLVSSYFM